MDSFDPTWAAIQRWTGGLDERGLASFGELAMARAPIRRLADTAVPAAGDMPDGGEELLAPGDPGPRGRPGKRW